MLVTCDRCQHVYNDATRWTLCPHGPLDAPHDAYCRRHDLAPCPFCVPGVTNPRIRIGPVDPALHRPTPDGEREACIPATYDGPVQALLGEEALIQIDPDHPEWCKAQFNSYRPYMYGWHGFPTLDFRRRDT